MPAAHGPISAATCGITPLAIDLLAEQVARAGEQRADRLLDPRARGVEQPHERDPLGQRQLAQARDLHLAGHAHRAGHDREVVGGDGDHPPVDLAVAGDDAVGRRLLVLQPAHGVVDAGVDAQLGERARVDQQVDAARARSACPRACWRAILSSPPPSFARSRRSGSSSTSGRRIEVGLVVLAHAVGSLPPRSAASSFSASSTASRVVRRSSTSVTVAAARSRSTERSRSRPLARLVVDRAQRAERLAAAGDQRHAEVGDHLQLLDRGVALDDRVHAGVLDLQRRAGEDHVLAEGVRQRRAPGGRDRLGQPDLAAEELLLLGDHREQRDRRLADRARRAA